MNSADRTAPGGVHRARVGFLRGAPIRAAGLDGSRLARRLSAAFLAFAAGTFAASEPPSPNDWRWSHPLPHGNNIADIAHAGGTFVQVTDRGGIYVSTNRVVWERRESGTTADLRGAAFLGSRLLVTGANGTVLWSDDAAVFQAASVVPPTTNWFEGVAASPDVAVAVGDNGAIYRTSDGRVWTRTPGPGIEQWLSGVAYGDGRFVAVGELGCIVSSTDGETWTRAESGTTADLTRVAFGAGRFLAVGRGGVALTSTDGLSWSPDGTPGVTNDLLAAAVGPTSRLVVGDSAVLLRSDSSDWVSQTTDAATPSPAPEWTWLAALWDGERFLAGGRTGVTIESLHTNVPPLGNVTLWFRTDESPRTWLWDMDRIGDLYLAVGDRATILSSSSGVTWTVEPPPASAETVLYGIGGSDRMALAVGSEGVMLRSQALFTNVVITNRIVAAGRTNILVATNRLNLIGVLWEEVHPRPVTNTLQGVAWRDGQFVAVGSAGTVLRSADAIEWTVGSAPTSEFLSSVAPAPQGWVASGTGGTLLFSPDAVSWENLSSGTSTWIYRVRNLPAGMVAVGRDGLIMVSSDGRQWSHRASGTSAWLTDVRQVGGAVYVGGLQGTLLRSTNLVDWQPLSIPTGKALQALAVHRSQLVAAGAEGIILRAIAEPDASAVSIVAYRHSRDADPPVDLFLFEGVPELRFRLERAPMLGAWEQEGSLRLGPEGAVSHGLAAPDGTRFYRAVIDSGASR